MGRRNIHLRQEQVFRSLANCHLVFTRLDIEGSVRWRPGPAASERRSINCWWLGLWPLQKKININSLGTYILSLVHPDVGLVLANSDLCRCRRCRGFRASSLCCGSLKLEENPSLKRCRIESIDHPWSADRLWHTWLLPVCTGIDGTSGYIEILSLSALITQ